MILERRQVGFRASILLILAVVHGALILLLARDRQPHGMMVPPSAPALKLSNVSDSPLVVRPDPPAFIAAVVTADVAEPDVATEPVVDVAGATHKAIVESNDPFAGVALPPSRNDASLPYSGAYLQWVAAARSAVRSRGAANRAQHGIVIELLCQPAGGFTDARMKVGTGSAAIDAELLARIANWQLLVPPGVVAEPGWLAMPSFILAT